MKHPRYYSIFFTSAIPLWLCLALLAACAPQADQTLESSSALLGIHQEDWQKHQHSPTIRFAEQAGLNSLETTAESAALYRTVFGFYPYWINGYSTIRWDLLTHLAWFAVEAKADGSISNTHGWPDTDLIETAHANGVKVILTVTCFSSSSITGILSSSDNRTKLVQGLWTEVAKGSADGVNIDFEGVPVAQKANLVAFMTELNQWFKMQNRASSVTLDTPAVDWSGAFDYDQLALNSDGLMIMAYNYYWSGSSQAGPVSPLSGWGTYNVNWTVQDYIKYGGEENKNKYILGLPYYGYNWPTVSGSVPAKTTGKGNAVTYAEARSDLDTYARQWDSESQTPWYTYGSYYQTWYDDDESLGLKYDLVNSSNLQGIGIWALGYDGSYPELWDQIEKSFTVSASTCPMVAVSSADPNAGLMLNNYRSLRDYFLKATPQGRWYIRSYNEHRQDFVAFFARHPLLAADALRLLHKLDTYLDNVPVVQYGEIRLSAADQQEILAFLTKIKPLFAENMSALLEKIMADVATMGDQTLYDWLTGN
jgi:spore germination protein YaaH